jgi:hypothetical protein
MNQNFYAYKKQMNAIPKSFKHERISVYRKASLVRAFIKYENTFIELIEILEFNFD